MVQGYYTLQEAADVLGLSPDALKQMAQKNKLRSFQDRGTLRFRIQDIQDLQRQQQASSDGELAVGESPKSTVGKTPKPTSAAKAAPEAFDFDLDDSVGLGVEGEGSGVLKKGASKGKPKKGSDSDVKLVADDSENFSIRPEPKKEEGDSDVQLGELFPTPSPSASRKSGLGKRKSKLGPSPADSGVRLVGMSPPHAESDVRLDRPATSKRDSKVKTEEIDLGPPPTPAKGKPVTQAKPKSSPRAVSPFELSDSDVDAPKSGAKRKDTEFELDGKDSDEDFSLELEDDALDLGKTIPTGAAPLSGINLNRPADSGVSLEKKDSDDDFEFDLTGPKTPKPSQAVDSDSEFELTLDDAPKTPKPKKKKGADDSSEMDLTLDFNAPALEAEANSDSEFELTLDAEEPKPAKKPAKKKKAEEVDSDSEFELTLDDVAEDSKGGGDKDIFETDFEVPALDEASDASTVDAGSSDFELALDDSDIAPEDESGSQVVALEEEEDIVEEGAETVAGDYGDVEVDDGDVAVEEGAGEVVVQEVVHERWMRPAPWGVLPTVFMFPCVVVMIVVGIMGFELIQGSTGYRSSGVLTKSIADMIGLKTR